MTSIGVTSEQVNTVSFSANFNSLLVVNAVNLGVSFCNQLSLVFDIDFTGISLDLLCFVNPFARNNIPALRSGHNVPSVMLHERLVFRGHCRFPMWSIVTSDCLTERFRLCVRSDESCICSPLPRGISDTGRASHSCTIIDRWLHTFGRIFARSPWNITIQLFIIIVFELNICTVILLNTWRVSLNFLVNFVSSSQISVDSFTVENMGVRQRPCSVVVNYGNG
jgi:hypothetical protein